MKKIALSLTAGLLMLGTAFAAFSGRDIMDKSNALKKPDTLKASMLMTIYKGDTVQEKEFDIIGKKAGKDDKVLITFSKPTKIKFLTHTHKSGDDDQWLMLTSGKVKRIAASERDQAFVNSHLYYEDMKSRDIDGYNYNLIGEAKAVGEDCYKVEATPKDASNVYSKAVFYVRKSDFFVLRADIFKGGVFHKYVENYDIRLLNGILTPYHSVMYLADGKNRTELRIKSIEYNKSVSDSALNKEVLR
jgi:outer membrane lipoprotein-sorting protein